MGPTQAHLPAEGEEGEEHRRFESMTEVQVEVVAERCFGPMMEVQVVVAEHRFDAQVFGVVEAGFEQEPQGSLSVEAEEQPDLLASEVVEAAMEMA